MKTTNWTESPMKTTETLVAMKLPSLAEIARLVRAVKADICDEYRAFEDDETPGIQLTVGCSIDGSWSWQTGDNSFTGGAYGHPHWGVAGVYRRSNSREVAADILDQIAEAMHYEWSEENERALRSAGLNG